MSAAQGGVAPAQRLPPTEEELADAEHGLYSADASTIIVCVGDLEGNSLTKLINPKGASEHSETGVLMQTASNLTEIYGYLQVVRVDDDSTPDVLLLKPNVILVYLGDVIGDGPHNIELVTLLLKLKEDNPTRVIIITGNRDVNKFRLGWELEPTAACMADLIPRVANSSRTNNFGDFRFEFKYNTADDFDYMWGKTPEEISNKPDCLDRVLYITEETFNEYYGWVFLVDEYLTTIGKSQEIETTSLEHKSYIYVYLVQAMSGVIPCDDAPDFNNIFEKLLMKSHLMACIEAGDTYKFGFMHSLPPRGKIPTIPGYIYKGQFDAVNGMERKDQNKPNNVVSNFKDSSITANNVSINDGLRVFNQSLRRLIKEYHDNPDNPDNRRQLLEWVSGMTTGSYWLYTKNSIIGANMPISTVSFGTGFDQFETASGIKIQGGGGIDALRASIATEYFDINDFTHVVCSHSPKGYVGVKVKTTDDKFYYCIDVSKIDDQEYVVKNRFGCCFLVFDLSTSKGDSVDDKFIGRIMLKQSQFPQNYDILTGEINGKVFNNSNPMYANYVVGSPIPVSTKAYMEQILPLKIDDKGYMFEFRNNNNGKAAPEPAARRLSGKVVPVYFNKSPRLIENPAKVKEEEEEEKATAEPSGAGAAPAPDSGGSRTRKRRSKYPKKPARTTHKRRRISKKLNRNKKNKKSKYGARR